MLLSELKTGESATILKVHGHGSFRKRIMEMGFVRGKRVDVLLNAPLKDPIKYKVMGYEVSLRRSEAAMINVITEEEALGNMSGKHATEAEQQEYISNVIKEYKTTINIALVGNPNSGKTSLFNAISGRHEHVGNYSGVTVDATQGTYKYKGYTLIITDLPGTYALSPYSPEERYVREHLETSSPDIILNVVAASNLERNLYLTTELIDMDVKCVVALNMYDELEKSGAKLDNKKLGAMLGLPMVPVIAKKGEGITELLDTIIEVYENRNPQVRHIHINNGHIIEEGLDRLKTAIKESGHELPKTFPPRYYALKMLEKDSQIEEKLSVYPDYPKWKEVRDREVKHIEGDLGEDIEEALTGQKYGFIGGALKETLQPGKEGDEIKATHIIDALVTHKVWGFPVFFLLISIMFYCTFSLGAYPQEWIERGVTLLSDYISSIMPDGQLKDLIIDGAIGGVGSVIVFLPNIMILYLFISFLEDSGYLARAAFIMDKVMHKIGLHGKSFIPLVMGFGCNVPAVMAARTIESRSSRLITILILPFMSCSARIPIYILLIGTFFPAHGGIILTLFYLGGIVMAVITAKLMRRFLFKTDETPFVMELPPYRLPSLYTTVTHMWDKCKQYLKKMGGLILVASVIVWFLSYYPTPDEPGYTPAQRTEQSYLARIGKFCEPVVRPIGMKWQACVAALSGVSAKEIVVSTLGVLYSDNSEEEISDARLSDKLKQSGDFTAASALAFLVFSLLYFPCIATLAAIKNEAGWGWASASMIYNTVVAWIISYIVYNLALIL